MKKFFSLFAAVLLAGSMMADSYTITFKDAGAGKGDSSTSLTSTNIADYVADGAAYVSAIAASGKVYNGQDGYGLKFGNSSNPGSVTLTLAAAVTPTSIVMNASPWSATEGAGLLQDSVFATTSTGAKGTFANFTYIYDGATQVTTIVVGTSTKRGYVKSITVNYGEVVPPTPTMDYYVVGNMTSWAANANYKLVANPATEGEYMGKFTFAANAEFKVAYSDGTTIEDANWFPTGMGNNFQITEDGEYNVYFRPDGQGGEGWHYGYIYAAKKVIPQYEVAGAIAAGLTDNDEILVRGIITKMELKGKNFAKYGSVNIYVADATGAEGEFEFYNCYSLNADTFKTTDPAFDANSQAYAEFEEVADANGNAIHVGDTIIAFGKYKLYNTTYELNTGCYLTEIKPFVEAPAAPVDRRIIAWDLKSVLEGDNYKFTYKSNIAGTAANLIFYDNNVEAGRVAMNAPVAGLNEFTMSKLNLPAGELTWAVEVKAGDVVSFAEFTDASRGIYDFYLPQGISVNNCTESDYFGHMYITERNGATDGGCDRTKAQQGGIFEYDLALNELNPTNQGWVPEGITVGTDRQEIKRISVDPEDGMIYYNSTTAIYKINPATITAAPTNILAGKEGITKVNSCYAKEGVVYFMDNANTTNGGTLKKIDEEGVVTTIVQNTIWANQDNAICSDGRDGLWVAQHRAQIDAYSILTHIAVDGTIDFKVVTTSDADIKALFPSTNGQPAYRGQLAYNEDEDILAFAGNMVVSLFKVTYDAVTGAPSLQRLMQTAVTGGNIDGVSFDYAGNVYFLSASVERLYAYGVPTESNEVIVPAKSTLKVRSDATAIDSNVVAPKVEKIFRNGQVLIIKNGKTYNMMGQVVE